MKKTLYIIAFLSLILNSSAQTERRFQIWNKNEAAIRLGQKTSIEVAEKIHYSPERNAADLKFAELSVFRELKEWFNYGAGFRISKSNTYPGWLQEYRPMIYADFNQSYRKFDFTYSNRFEYRIFETGLEYFRYRQSFLIKLPKLASWGIQFYTSEESFFNFRSSEIHLFRVYGGLSVVQTEHFELKTYYSLEKFKPVENWKSTDIAGLNMSFVL
jgi:hypothetical protein